MKHQYINININVTNEYISDCARKYIGQRGKVKADLNELSQDPSFKSTGFNVEKISEVINRHTTPKRPKSGSTKAKHLDIYRSDLGELLMTTFFEEELSKQIHGEDNFIIPLKNIWDRETNDLPGRGLDTVGYRCTNPSKPTLLLGESKVSSEKLNPPRVVHANEDSLYKTQLTHASDPTYLLRKLCNLSKKLPTRDSAILSVIILGIDFGDDSYYDVVYGCTMVRDKSCLLINQDYGKLMTEQTKFDPNYIYFYLPSFSEPIDVVVEKFYDEVNK